MKKRYMLIFLGILLIGITIFFIFEQPESPFENAINSTTKQEGAEPEDTTIEQQDPPQEEDPSSPEATGESALQLQEMFNEAVQRTADFFNNRESNITALGDSLTQGVGDHVVKGGYVGILDQTINKNRQLVSFDNYGKRGHRSAQLLKRLDNPEVAQSIEKADMILITIGANDIMQVVKENFTSLKMNDFTPAEKTYEDQLRQIFDKLNDLNHNADIYLVGIYNPFIHYFPDIKELSKIVADWNETSRGVTQQYDNATFIPTADLFADGEEELFAEDHFHPSHRGYQLFARRVLDYLTDQ
ncbi:SGNH/GDSL hydrolase family protein [Lentibacillus salicampi]|uniref:SGNH hydrolase-type esterase domain-containing protein n=1 Tax=Lentibacillus salicampi TaxID=175306 RepID=A0A4Y9ACB3_9BACI|nr:SGNH/GDSL hydrolase family protein [Lentibacillus salicampi]TFJ93443.1 hypothetical protein E4U82_07185 [Lentibacillus salicampi]